MFATYWDDAWHTDRGRDEFFIAPHLTLYAGVTVAGLVTAWWLLRAYLAAGGGIGGALMLLRLPAALLALLGATATLLSAPIDNAWHELYGRDAVVWSPPHMLGVAGSAAMSVGLLAGMTGARDRLAPLGRVLLGAGVLGSFLVPVLEFDSDVPQFPAWTYWPVATAGLVLFVLVARDLADGRWAVTAMAAVYTAAKFGIVVALAAMDHSGTLIPPVLAVAVADDVLYRRGAPPLIRAMAAAVLVPVAWTVAVAAQPGQATQVPADQAVLGVVTSLGAALLVVAANGNVRLRRPLTPQPALVAVTVAAAAAVLAAPQPAWAHDPGQGVPVGQVTFDVSRDGERVDLTGRLATDKHDCGDLEPVEAVARRAGEEQTSPLSIAGCTLAAQLTLPDNGRWFLYVNLADTAGHHAEPELLESWIPLAGNATSVREDRDLYLVADGADSGPTQAQIASGLLLYAAVLGLLIAAVRLARRTGAARQEAQRDSATQGTLVVDA